MPDNLSRFLREPACALVPRARGWLVLFLVAYTLAGAFALDRWQHRAGQSVHQLGFGYGVLIDALDRTGEYRVEGVHYPGIAFSAHRLPFIPYFLRALRDLLGDDLGRIALVKCAVFNALLGLALARVLATVRVPLGWTLALLAFVLTMPRWVLNVFEVGLEEGYNITVLALLFALLWFADPRERRGMRWALTLGGVLVLLLFLKSSMVYWCAAVPVLIGWGGQRRTALVVAALVVAGLVGLAAFNRAHAGRFTIASSWEGWNLFKGNNPRALELYPPYSLDLQDYEGGVQADRPLRDEWDHDAYFRGRAVAFIRANPGAFLELAARKAWIFFGEVRASGLQRGESRYATPVHFLQVAWMLAFRALLAAAILLAARTAWRDHGATEAGRTAVGYLAFLVLYAGFHVVGFAYERHVMPIVLPTIFYLLWRWDRNAVA